MITVNGVTVYDPTPKQLEFHLCPAKYPLYGGAAGGGKSHALRWHGYMSCLSVPRFRVLLLRRLLRDLERTHCEAAMIDAKLFNATWVKSDYVMRFPNESVLELGHCQHEDDVVNYLSAEYDLILFDELVTFSEYQYLMISSRCRTTKPGITERVLSATNPGGKESNWVRRRWILRDLTPEDDPTYHAEDYAYIPATLVDNPYINQQAYEQNLSRLPEALARAYRDGDWDIFQGQYFSEFRRAFHVADLGEVSPSLPRVGGFDWGYADPGVYVQAVVTPDGQLYVEDEFVFNGAARHGRKMIISEVAEYLAKRRKERGIRVNAIYADPDIFRMKGHLGESMAETASRFGLNLDEGDNDRVNGWARVRAWLREMPPHPELQARPWMVIHPRCVYLARTLPQMVMDDKNPEDIVTRSEDHACDALRYLIMGMPSPAGVRVEPSYPRHTMGYLKQQILQNANPRPLLGRRAMRTRHAGYLGHRRAHA